MGLSVAAASPVVVVVVKNGVVEEELALDVGVWVIVDEAPVDVVDGAADVDELVEEPDVRDDMAVRMREIRFRRRRERGRSSSPGHGQTRNSLIDRRPTAPVYSCLALSPRFPQAVCTYRKYDAGRA